jgi:glycosyltransferase involved in cell wall biosynthesis
MMTRPQGTGSSKAVFVLAARNCAATLPGVLANVARLAALFGDSAVLVLENDSRDATRAIAQNWCAGRPGARLVTVDGLSANRVRTLCLAAVRNKALDLVRGDYAGHDYLFVMDADEVNSGVIDGEAVRRAIAFLEEDDSRAGVFANSLGVYFDMWALRHPEICPGDVWEEVCDHVIAHGVGDAEAYRATLARRIFSLKPDAPPLAVESAFGGLGVYRIKSVLANARPYEGAKRKFIPPHMAGLTGETGRELGWQVCEHVAFHQGFRARGESLFILPFLINCRTMNADFPPSAWRSFLFETSAAAAIAAPASRNEPCPCGSGLRFKHCHGRVT